MAADGRNVLGRDGAASPGEQGGAWQSQGRNLTALRPAGGAGSRKNLLRTMPWYPCSSINTAIREISPSAGDWHIASYSGHYIRCATAKGPGCVEYELLHSLNSDLTFSVSWSTSTAMPGAAEWRLLGTRGHPRDATHLPPRVGTTADRVG
jgi:hypothetical protein